jgi:glycosyl transferase family 2
MAGSHPAVTDYELWSDLQSTGTAELEAMRARVTVLARRPLISLALVAGGMDELWLREGIRSIIDQAYPHWQLCVCDTGIRSSTEDALAGLSGDDDRVEIDREPNVDSPEALTRAVGLARGEYVGVIDEGAELAPEALFRVSEAALNTGADIIYTDEDLLDSVGRRSEPTFKPAFSPDLLLSRQYLGRLCLLRRDLVELMGGLDRELGTAAEHDLILRVSEVTKRVVHLPGVFYHRRAVGRSPAAPSATPADTKRAAEAALVRRGERGIVQTRIRSGDLRIARSPSRATTVSLLVWSRRRQRQLPIFHWLSRRTDFPVHEAFVVGHEARDTAFARFLGGPLSTAANLAAVEATGDVLVFVEGRSALGSGVGGAWLGELVGNAVRQEIGVVSGKVLNAAGDLRYGGSVGSLENLLAPSPPVSGEEAAYSSDANSTLNPGTATAELMAVRRSVFEQIGGFDDVNLSGSFLGLDLAFRLEECGLRSAYTPYAVIQCPDDGPPPTANEVEYMWRRWPSRLAEVAHSERRASRVHDGGFGNDLIAPAAVAELAHEGI